MSFLNIYKKITEHEKERDRNLRLHCERVAARHQREIDKLNKELEKRRNNGTENDNNPV